MEDSRWKMVEDIYLGTILYPLSSILYSLFLFTHRRLTLMALPWQDPLARFREVLVERNVPARMRDGTILYADIYRPKGDGPWPVLLIRQPYDKTQPEGITYAHPSWYARYGY